MRNSKSVGLIALTALAVAVMTACSSGSPGGSSSASGEADEQITIGYAVPVVANPYWQGNIAFAQQMADELDVELIVQDARDQADTQLKNIEDLIATGVDGIIFGPINTTVGPAILKLCESSGTPCVAAERLPGVEPDEASKEYFPGYVVGDDKDLGFRSAELLAEDGATTCVAMSGQVGNSVADRRLEGFLEGAEANGLTVASTFRPAELAAEGQQAMENFLSQLPGPGFDCMWGFDGDVGTGSISALTNAGALDQVRISGIGPTQDNLREIADGQMLSSIGGEFMDGGFALIMVYDVINGNYETSGPVVLRGVTIQQDNVAEYAAQFGGETVTGYSAKELSATHNPDATTDGFEVVLK